MQINKEIENYSLTGTQYYENSIPEILQNYLNKGGITILDVGCGDGSLLDALKNHGYLNNNKIYAVDLSQNRVNLIKKIDKRIIAKVDNAETLDEIKTSSIDLLISTQVIEHVDDSKMCKAIERVVKNNGIVYLSTVFKKKWAWYFRKNKTGFVLDKTHLREYSADYQLLKKIGKPSKILETKKTLFYYPIADFFIRRLLSPIRNRRGIFWRIVMSIKVPIIGFYNWEFVYKIKK